LCELLLVVAVAESPSSPICTFIFILLLAESTDWLESRGRGNPESGARPNRGRRGWPLWPLALAAVPSDPLRTDPRREDEEAEAESDRSRPGPDEPSPLMAAAAELSVEKSREETRLALALALALAW